MIKQKSHTNLVLFSFLFLPCFLSSKTETNIIKDTNEVSDKLKKNKNYEEIFEDSQNIGVGSGSLNRNFDTASDVINLGGMTIPANVLCTKCGVEISLTGRTRVEGMNAVNTKYFNEQNLALDNYTIPGKSTIDIGILAVAGKKSIYKKPVVSLGIDLRSRSTWGKPDQVAVTTVTTLNQDGASYGTHNHTIGVPILYVRGLDLTLDLNSIICTIPGEYPTQKLKLGFFPIEIGRGISLGAAYAVSPDILSYAPADVIQEFAPGFMLYGTANSKETLDYRIYLGIIKNNSGSHSDLITQANINRYGMEYFPYRGSGLFNIVSAFQIDWRCHCNGNNKAVLSPYLIIGHEGAGKIISIEDSTSNLVTLGLEFAAEQDQWIMDLEFAKNFGSQYVFGIDTNTIQKEQRTCSIEGNNNSTVGVLINDKVIFDGYANSPASLTTDIVNKPATFLGKDSKRQKAINSVYKSSTENGKIIFFSEEGYSLKNAEDRFRDPYQNFLDGFMLVFDIARIININETLYKWAFAFGYASGDDHPNKSLEKKNDHIVNGFYEGFSGIQEIYSGKMVRSVFFLQGVGKMPRVGSIPAVLEDEEGQIIETIEYPSPISGFNNLLYSGTSINFAHDSGNYDWKWHPNLLFYWQPTARTIYNTNIVNILEKNSLDSFLGTEVNLFLEIISKKIEGLKFFIVGTAFMPGSYYTDLSKIPLDKKQEKYINSVNNGEKAIFTPLINTNTAYYINLGLVFSF